jgi:hypothetical protein
LHLARIESRFLLSHGRFDVVIRTRLFHTFCLVGQNQIAQGA